MSKTPTEITTSLSPSEKEDLNRFGAVADINIWNERPAFKDVNKFCIYLKSGFIIGIFLIFTLLLYYCSGALIPSFLFPSLIIFFFVLIFFQDIFYYFPKFRYSGIKRIELFKNCSFRIKDKNSDTLFIFNRKENLVTGIKLFKIDILPETIEGNVYRFLSSLDRTGIPYVYQIIQTSNIQLIKRSSDFSDKKEKMRVRNTLQNSQTSFNISLFLATSYCNMNKIISVALDEIQNSLNRYGKGIISSFIACFPHHHLTELKGLELINGLYTLFFKTEVEPRKDNEKSFKNRNWRSTIIRIVYLFIFISFEAFLLFSVGISVDFNILVNLIVLIGILFIYWREIFSSLTDKFIFRDFLRLNLFNDYKFFMRAGIPDSVFVWNEELKLLIGIKLFAVRNIMTRGYCNPDKFIRAISPFKLSYSYTTIQAALSQFDLEKDYMKYLKSKIIYSMQKYYNNEEKLLKWLSMRAGIWRFMFLISINSYKFTSYISTEIIDNLELELQERFETIHLAFQETYSDYVPLVLRNRRLILGIKVILLKNKFIRRGGTYIPYSLIQGKILKEVNKIMNELKKGIKTQVAVEFNTPLSLKNEILIGNTINTEFFREEIPFGLLFNQINNLIISGGTHRQREDICMKIITELVKNKIPSIIFDFNGKYSRLIEIFSKTQFYRDFYYFKLGQSFNIELLNSGIKNDPKNLEYLDYICEAIGCIKKLNDKEIQTIRDLISKVPMDSKSITMDMEMEDKWKKNKNYNEKYIASVFNDYTQQTRNTISAIGIVEENINSNDFLKDDKTVIIDLSILSPPLNIFAMFVLISRIIHYTQEGKDYIPKLLVMPNVEYFFDKFYLDKFIKPYTIDRFLNPLKEKGFGFMFLVNEVNKLHPTFFDYIQNFMALKTVQPADLMVLKNLLNLQEIQGQGYYTKSRKNTYHIDFLKQLRNNNAIVLRDDIDQPFPVKIDIDSLAAIPIPKYLELSEYMKEFGYNFQKTEEQILNSIEKTIFEKDFQQYLFLLDDIINFLRALNRIDTIGNIYEFKIKEQLFKFIHKKLVAKDYKRKQISKIRDDLFNVLISHQYLVENHPREAGGSQSMRTSYSVGHQFVKALDDHYDSKKKINDQVDLQLIEKRKINVNEIIPKKEEIFEYFVPPDSDQNKQQVIIKTKKKISNSKNILASLIGALLVNGTIRAGKELRRNQYKDTILKVRDVLSKFLYKLYDFKFDEKSNAKIHSDVLLEAVDFIAESNIIPFNRQELYDILKMINIIKIKSGELENTAKNHYEMLYDFTQKILIGVMD